MGKDESAERQRPPPPSEQSVSWRSRDRVRGGGVGGQAGRCFDRPLWMENPDPSRSEAAAAAAAYQTTRTIGGGAKR